MEFLKRLFAKPLAEADLNRECALGATEYLKKNGKGLGMLETQNMANYVAHGFYMGVRATEERLGIKNDVSE